MSKEAKIKRGGQVFTPNYLVEHILDFADYRGEHVLRRHIMDNSCGDGAFLCAIVRRYAEAFLAIGTNRATLAAELQTYVHGIEIDVEAHANCMARLTAMAQSLGLGAVQWDVRCTDALSVREYDGRMDFVVGNPPYVRVHNLGNTYTAVKTFHFATGGMTDLYLAFYEIGLRMLRPGGTLCYIAPSSWLTSLAGAGLRHYIRTSRCLKGVIDLEHFQPFTATAYTLIVRLVKGGHFDEFDYYRYDGPHRTYTLVARLPFSCAFIGPNLYLSTPSALTTFASMVQGVSHRYIQVKNGFATLADKVFIRPDFPFSHMVIPVVKASTGQWARAFFPYNQQGRPYTRADIFADARVARYLEANKSLLLKGRSETDEPEWFLYGRTQAIRDVGIYKIAVSSLVRDVASIKLCEAPAGSGVYGGLYIVGCSDFGLIRTIVQSEDFVNYAALLKKYKSGGYYTYSSRELEIFINWKLSNDNKPTSDEQQRIFGDHRELF